MIGAIKEFYRKKKYGTPIIVVSGLPRSGTSMMMKMLEAGGLEIFTDNIRKADEDNTMGYYECEKVKTLDKDVDKSWLGDAKGKGLKVISSLLNELPDIYFYKGIIMHRNVDEVISSQNKMLTRKGERISPDDDNRVKVIFENHLDTVRRWIEIQPNFDVLHMSYKEVLDDPRGHSRQIGEFLRRDLTVEKMADVVDKQLYRNRS